MRLVVLESPYAPKGLRYGSTYQADLDKELAENLRYARLCMRDCLMRGEAPFASHLLFTQDEVLDDTKPEERKLGMNAGFDWGQHAASSVVYTDLGISDGMAYGVKQMGLLGIPVEYRTLPGWDGWKDPPQKPTTRLYGGKL